MKKILLLFVLTLSAISTFAYDVEIDGIYYNLVPKAKQATVVNNGNEGCYSGEIVIPSSIIVDDVTYSVTKIGDYSFFYCSYLTSISIPNTVVTIGNYAFLYCQKLSSVSIGHSVTSIGDYAFDECTSLASIEIPNSVVKIGDEAFANCSRLSSFFLPNSVTYIGGRAFFGCTALTSVNIPNLVTTIDVGTFERCPALTSIVIPNNVRTIASYAFSGCSKLTSITIPNSVTTIKEQAFAGCSSLTSVKISNSVGELEEHTFSGCINLISVDIPNSVRRLGHHIFNGCSKLKNITINCNTELPQIDYSAFLNCPSIETVTIASNDIITGFSNTNSNIFDGSYIEYATLYVPTGSDVSGSVWGNFGTILPFNAVDDPTNRALIDGEAFGNTSTYDNRNITYTRNFTNTNWNALYVPFSMQYNDWADDFEIARLNDVHQFDDDEDGVIDRTVLEVIKLKEGSMTEPNVPYMIRAKKVGEKTITLTGATLYATDEKSFDVTSWYTKFTFTGTYNTVTDMATKGHYALANGGLKQASSNAATLSPFRWYLDITDRNGGSVSLNAKTIFLSFDDGETTEIKVVGTNTETNASPIYYISGVNVGNKKASLSRGVYIRNGKKYLIK